MQDARAGAADARMARPGRHERLVATRHFDREDEVAQACALRDRDTLGVREQLSLVHRPPARGATLACATDCRCIHSPPALTTSPLLAPVRAEAGRFRSGAESVAGWRHARSPASRSDGNWATAIGSALCVCPMLTERQCAVCVAPTRAHGRRFSSALRMRPLTSASLPMTERQALQTPAASARCATDASCGMTSATARKGKGTTRRPFLSIARGRKKGVFHPPLFLGRSLLFPN